MIFIESNISVHDRAVEAFSACKDLLDVFLYLDLHVRNLETAVV